MAQFQDEIELHRHLVADYRFRFQSKIQKFYHHYWNERLLSLAQLAAEATVLDFGCGTGILLGDLLEQYQDVKGVDISPDMLNEARKSFPGLDLRVSSGENLPWPDSTFDAVFSRGSFHHLIDLDKGLQEISRVLKPGGTFVLSEPCNDSPVLRLIRFFWYRLSAKFSIHHKAFRTRELKSLLDKAGFRVDREIRFGFLAFPLVGMVDFLSILRFLPGKKFLIWLDTIFEKMPLLKNQSWHIILRAKKIQ